MAAFRLVPGLLLLAVLGVASGGAQQAVSPGSQPSTRDTVVARYNGTMITLAELDSAFVASAGGPAGIADSSLRDYRAFLDKYVNYRLKVRAARDAGLDTLQSIKRDVHTYRRKLARPEVLRTGVYEPVARTLYERRNRAVDVSHILIRTSSAQDTAAAYRTIQQIADSLEQGISFGDLAYRNSEDPSAREQDSQGYRGRLGYLRAGQIVEPFERRMYALPPGEVSDVFRTKYGYHILKVHDRRAAQPPLQLSHILRRGGKNSPRPQQFLDSLRARIISGGLSFSLAAEQHSQDPRSAAKGGALGTVNPQGLPPGLRSAVARLDTVGTVSEVVRSRFGYHLLKLTGRQTRQSFEAAYPRLKEEVSGEPRAERQKTAFAREVRAIEGTTVDTTRLLRATSMRSVDSLAHPLLSRADRLSSSPRAIASLGDSTYTLSQMARHLMQTDGGARMTLAQLIESFLDEKALQYAVMRRAQQDSSLAQEIRTYREGTLLFRYMQDSVWTAAARDTAGLRTTYRRNKSQYRFPKRIRTLVLRAPADSLLQPYKRAHEAGRSPVAIMQAAARDSLVAADTAFVTDKSPDVYRPVREAKDQHSVGPTAQDNQWLFMIRDTQLQARLKRFEEAQSSVLQDYQEVYERRVIRRLRDRYDAATYPSRLRRLPSVAPTGP